MEKDASISVRSLARDYWFLAHPYKRLIANAVFWALLLQIAALAEPYSIKIVVDQVQSGGLHGLLELLEVGAVLLCFMAASGFIQVSKVWRSLLVVLPMDRDLPLNAIRKLMRLSRSFHERENAGLLMGKVSKGLQRTEDLTAAILFDISSLTLQTCVAAVVIAWYDLHALGIFLTTVCVFGILTVHLKHRMAPSRKVRHELDGHSDELMGQAIMNVATVQSFAREERECARVEQVRREIHDMARRDWRINMRFDFLRNLVISFGRVVVIVVTADAAIRGEMTVGSFILVTQLADQVFKNCYRIGSIYDRMQEASEAVRRLADIHRVEERIVDPVNPVDASLIDGEVTFSGVTYHYDTKMLKDVGAVTRPALSGLSLRIKAGEHVAIVGLSGGGKSTLVKLILRTDDPTAGSVELSGTPLTLFRRADFLERIGYVPQDVEIFDLTIGENIAYGREHATQDEIEAAAKAAHIHKYVETLPLKYSTPVGNRGMRLSGGQRQRIGIARALIKQPKILILDEATSHVDMDTERKIQRAIDALKGGGMTMIVIAHRLSTIVSADRILVMDGGRIVEEGAHAALLDGKGIYTRMLKEEEDAEDAS